MLFKRRVLSSLEVFSLQYGVSLKKLYKYSLCVGANPKNLHFKFKQKYSLIIQRHFDLEFYKRFQTFIKRRLYFFWNIRLYRGIRHKMHLPARGQRTHSNGRTKKKFKF